MDPTTWLLYVVACIGLSVSPGPNALLVVTHSAMHGRRRAMNTILGGALGFVAVVGLSMFGIGALLASSALWFTVLKWVGGGYLVYLGIQLWRAPPIDLQPAASEVVASAGAMFRQGFLSALTNPKAILFFAAFLPQFVDPARSLLLQFVVMSGTFALVEIGLELTLATMVQRLRPWLRRVGRRLNRVCGGAFMAIGAALPLRS